MLRIYWCCTHVTLRKTELPVFLAHNVEIVPEEVRTSVLSSSEGRSYENESIHPIIHQWQDRCTLDTDVLEIVRRARLSHRKGRITSEEQAFFNNYFDAIYVATDLDTAVEVKSWFKGDVIFRYFGFHNNLKILRQLVEKHDNDKLRSIIFCPIFTSLLELEGADKFERTAVIHGYIDQKHIKHVWSGWRDEQAAVAMGHNLHIGSDTETLKKLRELIPLAQQINIALMGKYDCKAAPADIGSAYTLIGQLPFETYLERFLSARMLIHPFGNPYHNHYTNVEACAAGMPVLLLRGNPLYNENELRGELENSPESYGAFADIDTLMKGALALFHDRQALEDLAVHQRQLLKSFSRETVQREVGALLDLIAKTRIEKPMQPQLTVFSRTPCTDPYHQRNNFVEGADDVPISAFLNEDHLTNACLNEVGDLVFRLTAASGCQQLFLTDGDSRLAEGRLHKITLLGRSRGLGAIDVTLEMWTSAGIIAVEKFNFSCLKDDGAFKIPFDIAVSEQASLVLYISVAGNTTVDFRSLSHNIDDADMNCGPFVSPDYPSSAVASHKGRYLVAIRRFLRNRLN